MQPKTCSKTVRFIWGQNMPWIKRETVLLYPLLLHGCDYSSTMYEWRHFVKEESCNLWYTQPCVYVCVCVRRVSSLQEHFKHRHTLWLSLLFNYVYMGQWRRQFSFLKSCESTYPVSCLSSYTACMCACFKGTADHWTLPPMLWKGFPLPLSLWLAAKAFYWLPGALSDARQVILLCRYSNLPAPMTPSPAHPFIVFVHVSVGSVMQ